MHGASDKVLVALLAVLIISLSFTWHKRARVLVLTVPLFSVPLKPPLIRTSFHAIRTLPGAAQTPLVKNFPGGMHGFVFVVPCRNHANYAP